MGEHDRQEEEKENMAPAQQWVIRPRQGGEDSLLEEGSGCSDSSSSNSHNTPKKQAGILRLPETPGTGQSVRFGKRLYDDGDESKMSNSTASMSAVIRSPLRGWTGEDGGEEKGAERSFARSYSPSSDESDRQEDGIHNGSPPGSPTLNASRMSQSDRRADEEETSMGGELSLDTIALPNLEGYSNLEDISFDFQGQDNTTATVQPRVAKAGTDSFEDVSFNESFLRAEIELAKRQMEEAEEGAEAGEEAAVGEREAISSGPTVVTGEDEDDEGKSEQGREGEQEHWQVGTPNKADGTLASEYMSTRSQASSRSAASSAPRWTTPTSQYAGWEQEQNDACRGGGQDALSSSDADAPTSDDADASMPADEPVSLPFKVDDSPSAQRASRRSSQRTSQWQSSPSLARLQSLTNTPARRSPLSEVLMPQAGTTDAGEGDSSVLAAGPERKQQEEQLTVTSVRAAPSSDPSCSPAPIHMTKTFSFSYTHPIIEEIFRETEELDQVHSERSEKLLERMERAERDARENELLLEKEREGAARARMEAEAAEVRLKRIEEEGERAEWQRRQRMQELEGLVAKLHDQLDRKQASSSGKGDRNGEEERTMAAEALVQSQREQLEEMQQQREEGDQQKAEYEREQRQWEEEQARQADHMERLTREHNNRMEEMEAEREAMQREMQMLREQSGQVDALEAERKDLQGERAALQDALSSAQRQIGDLQSRSAAEREGLEDNNGGLASTQMRLQEAETAIQTVEESNRQQVELIEAKEEEKRVLERKNREMEEENDGLLQSLAEAEEHRRQMEEDFLSKRDSALRESREREEKAVVLASEMQSRLETLEEKLAGMATRTTMLEREVGDRGLQLVKLQRAKERLEEDNVNYGIALASKQQELSLLKRNTPRSQRDTPLSAVRMRTTPSSLRLGLLASRPSMPPPLQEIQTIESSGQDESGSSLPPLQAGPTSARLTRRKTMDVETARAGGRPSNARVARASDADRASLAMPPPPAISSTRPARTERRMPVQGQPQPSVSRASLPLSRGVSDGGAAMTSGKTVPSGASSCSSLSSKTVQAKQSLSSSIAAHHGPMDISELQTSQGASNSRARDRLQERTRRDLHRARVPSTRPRSSLTAVPA